MGAKSFEGPTLSESDKDWGQTRTAAPPQFDPSVPWILVHSACCLFAFSVETPLPQGLAIPCSRCQARGADGMMKWLLTSQPLKWEQVGSRCLFPFGFLRALRLLFFSLSVLGPGSGQYPGRFCLRAGSFLFIRRESTACCMGSYCLTLERCGQCRETGHRSVTR